MKRLNNLSSHYQAILLAGVVICLRLALAWIFGAEVADLAQYHWMADIVERADNIYKTENLFHYTPIPMFLPVWSLQVAQTLGLPFHFVVKLPMILADAGIALLLWWQARKRSLQNTALWLGLGYAFNPVSLLTTSFHGSYSVLPAFFTLLAYCLVSFLPARHYYHLSALSLGMAIGLRGFPVLFTPFFVRKLKLDWRRKVIFVILAGLPSVITLLPFVIADFPSVWRGIFSYGGVIDYGWIASIRAYWLITTDNLYLPGTLGQNLLSFSKWLFLITYILMAVVFWLKHKRFSLLNGILGATLLFFALYGGISSQYLVWAIPFVLIVGSGWKTAYTWSATSSLVTFYLYYFPAILFGTLSIAWPEFNPIVMIFNLVSNTVFWAVCLAWLVYLFVHPTPDIALEFDEIHAPDSKTAMSPLQAWMAASRNQKLALLVDMLLVGYIGMIFALEINLLAQQSGEPLQELDVITVWSVGQMGNGLEELSAPLGLAVDKTGYVYVADRGNHQVKKFSPEGKSISTWLGDSANRTPFVEPSDIAIDANSGDIWVLDAGNSWIYRLGTEGKMEAVVNGTKLEMYSPRGLEIGPSGDIFVADTGRARILHLDQQGNVIATWGEFGTGPNQFRDPTGIIIQGNDLFVADVLNNRIVRYTLNGKQVEAFNTKEESAWLAADGAGHVFVSNSMTQEIFIYDLSGKLVNALAPEKNFPFIDGLAGIASTKDGRLYAAGAGQLFQFIIEWK